MIEFARVPGGLLRHRGRRVRGSSSRTAGSSRRRRGAARSSCSQTLDTDDGARRLGELGIGCNPGIQRFMKNVGVRREDRRHGPSRGRQLVHVHRRHEQSSIHWDIVKDLRTAGGSTPTAGSCRRTAAGRCPPSARRADVAISPASRALPTIRSRFARERAAAALAVQVGEHERRHRLAVHALRLGRRRAPARSAARRRRGSRRAAGREQAAAAELPVRVRDRAPPRRRTRRAPRPAGRRAPRRRAAASSVRQPSTGTPSVSSSSAVAGTSSSDLTPDETTSAWRRRERREVGRHVGRRRPAAVDAAEPAGRHEP